jgi:hypothetical protein
MENGIRNIGRYGIPKVSKETLFSTIKVFF